MEIGNQIAALADGTCSRADIARQLGIPYHQVRTYGIKHNLQFPKWRGPPPDPVPPEILRLADGTLSITEVARIVGLSRQRVYQIKERYGLSFRSSDSWQDRRVTPQDPPEVPTLKIERSWTGAISEMLAAADLIRRGWEVYHSMAGTGKFDLAAFKGARVLRVEVKSVQRAHHKRKDVDWSRCDVLAKVQADGNVFWDPFVPDSD